jgi:hypothetical protein
MEIPKDPRFDFAYLLSVVKRDWYNTPIDALIRSMYALCIIGNQSLFDDEVRESDERKNPQIYPKIQSKTGTR